jgi:hypothetical protein
MDIVKFFKDNDINLPLTRENGQTFVDFYKSKTNIFINKIDQMKSKKFNKCDIIREKIVDSRKTVKELSSAIVEAIRSTLSGNPAKAYDKLKTGLKVVKDHIENLRILSRDDLNMNQLYRIRTFESHEDLIKRPNMFHVPYNLSYLVQPRRYSLLGVPCLYLGGSLYVCWEELGRPRFESIYFSRFSVDQEKMYLLDFGYKPYSIGDLIYSFFRECYEGSPLYNFVVAQAVCWPLLAACSIRRLYKKASFHHEYIVPQLLLQWINDKDNETNFHGIRYFSVASHSKCQNPAMLCNYVFPCQGEEIGKKETFDSKNNRDEWINYNKDILELFKFSGPLYWPIVEKSIFSDDLTHRVPQQRNVTIEGPGIYNSYEKTPFGFLEGKSLNYKITRFDEKL